MGASHSMTKKHLLIAEKPSVGKSVADWLSRKLKVRAVPVGRSHIQVANYTISWLYGHLLENFDPHEYDASFKTWLASALPIIPPVFQLKPREEVDKVTRRKTGRPDPGTLAQIKVLQALLKEVDEVIGAGDADQEGQLLQDEFLIWSGNRKPVMRLWLAAIDDASIRKAWDSMKPNEDYAGYYWAARARSEADWLFGINGSRSCTLASQANGGNAVLSVGRVQTPTTALVVFREDEIRAFKKVDYYTPFIDLATAPEFNATWSPNKDTDTRLDSEGRLIAKKVADDIAAACKAAGKATVTLVDSTKEKELAPLPFALSTLQSHMDKKFGIGVELTLKLAQSLYEKKVSSYPRTDCQYLPESMHPEAPDITSVMLAGVKGLGPAPGKANLSLKSRAFNDKHVTAHHAIVPRPTTLAQLGTLTDQEMVVWLEIAKRYLLQFFPSAEYLSSEIELTCAGEPFRATGKVYTLRGWKDAFAALGIDPDEEEDATGVLPKVAVGDTINLKSSGVKRTTTKPPKRYTQGTLLEAMAAVHKYVSDPKLKAVLRENAGIGTEATRANTIGENLNRGFIVLDKKEIKPTPLGEQLINTLPRQITSPDMTALWQQAMDDIKKTGKKGYEAFIAGQTTWLRELVREVPTWFSGKSMTSMSKKAGSGLKTKPTAHKCLVCSGPMSHIEGKFGWFFGCKDTTCKSVFKDVGGTPVAKVTAPALTIGTLSTGHTCPKCGKGSMQTRVCGPTSKTPGKQFLSCSNYFSKGKDKCEHSVWPK